MTQGFVFYAPNVHTGGGFVLMQALTATCPRDLQLTAVLDARARDRVTLPAGAQVRWVEASVSSRLRAEAYLSSVAGANDIVLCFHGLPPLFTNRARVVLFLQNRLYLTQRLPLGYKFKTRLRLTVERFLSWVFRYRVAEYIVQTSSMQRAIVQWYGVRALRQGPVVKVMPFANAFPCPVVRNGATSDWDFVYVADGEAHKNHRVLLAAWQLLAQDGFHPSLALTLSPRDAALKLEVQGLAREAKLRVKDLGQMPHENVLALYSTAKAMIFPSTSESFGLPLIEASQLGLPILAGELDYVRDVCKPVQTFDPTSAVSIARAVKRFLELPEPLLKLLTPQEFWQELFPECKT